MCTNQRDCYRQHPDYCQTKDGINHKISLDLGPPLGNHKAQEEEHEKIEDLSPSLGEFYAMVTYLLESDL